MIENSIVFATLHVRPSAQAVALGAATVAAALPAPLKERVKLIDLFPHHSVDDMATSILAAHPAIVALGIYVWNHHQVIALAKQLRARQPDCRLIVGGPEVTANVDRFAHYQLFDYLVCGEGEDLIETVISAIESGDHREECCRSEIPVDLTRQISPWLDRQLIPAQGVLWETSRGCPFGCSFCFDARGDHGVRTVPYPRLEQELALFVEHGVSQVWVLDSTFNYPLERGKELIRLIARIAPHIHFHLEAKIEFIDEELVELLSTIHCSVQIGLQSANPQVVCKMRRHFDADQFRDHVALLHYAGITYGIDLMYGLPGDDDQGFRRSVDFVLGLQPNHVDLFPLAVLPGTELFQQQQHYGLEAEPDPPYRLIASRSMSPDAMAACGQLAALTDLFYNTGRAVGYFLDLCRAVDLEAVELVEAFGTWLLGSRGVTVQQLLDQNWTADQALSLQREFLRDWLAENTLAFLWPAVDDLIRFHSSWAQAQLGADIEVVEESVALDGRQLKNPWRCAGTVQLRRFNYCLDDWILAEGDLVEQAEYGETVGDIALFFRSDNQVECVRVEGIVPSCFPDDGSFPPVETLRSRGAIIDEESYLAWLSQAIAFGLVVAD